MDNNNQTPLRRLFVYGIFLDQEMRDRYGMYNAHYATVKNYATVGDYIVEAVKTPGYTLTGLTVEVDVTFWDALDSLERGYDRVEVITTDNDIAWMYVQKTA